MEKYRYLEHTADVKFQAFGNNLEEAFENAALAFTDVVVELKDVQSLSKKTIEIESESKESLLYDFLEKVLNLMEINRFVISEIDSLKIEKGKKLKLSAILSGDFGLEKYDFKREIKAVTYNEMVINEKPGNVTVQVVVDI